MPQVLEAGTYYTVEETAKVLGVGGVRIRRLIYAGRIEAVKIGPMHLVSEEAIYRFRQTRINKALEQLQEAEGRVKEVSS